MNQLQIDSLKQALLISPENFFLRKMLAETLQNLAQYEEAINQYQEALSLSPDDDILKINLATCFYKTQKYSTAQFILDELIEKNNTSPDVYMLLARVLLNQNSVKEAKIYYDRAIKQNSKLVDSDLEQLIRKELLDSDFAFGNMISDDEGDSLFSESQIEKSKIDFRDIGGLEKIKEEIALKVIHPLTNPEIYKAFGKKIGGGILLYGPPGCGKTLLARATAGEINANFISIGLTEVLDMWVGNSEKNLHEIFQNARLNTPCVLFFDEVDALGASRTDMRQATGRFLINQFLDELDGVKYSNEGILILGATNTPWYLDTAFRRPGRFDRVIFVSPPDAQAREEILTILLKDKPVENIDIKSLVKMTEGYSGADLKAIVDIAVEAKLPESLKQGRVISMTTSDFKTAVNRHHPTTKEWFSSAKNYALYSNEGGLYNDVLSYLKIN